MGALACDDEREERHRVSDSRLHLPRLLVPPPWQLRLHGCGGGGECGEWGVGVEEAAGGRAGGIHTRGGARGETGRRAVATLPPPPHLCIPPQEWSWSRPWPLGGGGGPGAGAGGGVSEGGIMAVGGSGDLGGDPSPPLPLPSPRARLPVLPVLFGAGVGLTDALFYTYLVGSIIGLGGTNLLGLGALAAGAGLGLLLAPFAAATSDVRMGGRRPAVVAMLAVAFVCAGAFAGVVGKFRPSTEAARASKPRLVAAVLLATAYRALTLAAPAVGATIEHAMVGPPAPFPIRRDAALATLYVTGRAGVLIGGIVILCVTDRERALPFVAAAAAAGLLTLSVSAMTLQRPPPPPPSPPADVDPNVDRDEDLPPPTTVFAKVKADVKGALVNTPPGLYAIYLTGSLYGVAYGQLAAVTAPYLAEVIFMQPVGSSEALEWTAKGFLIAWAVGIGVDAAVPSLADLVPSHNRWLWPLSLLGGGGLFAGLAVAESADLAVAMLGLHGIVTSSHAYYSTVVAAATVHPSLRAPTTAMRTATTQVGLLAGALLGGMLSARRDEGFRDVMALSAGACCLAAVAAACVGAFPPLARVSGVPTNANVLLQRAAAAVQQRRRRRQEGGSGGNGGEGEGTAAAADPPAMRWHNQMSMNYWLEDEVFYDGKDRMGEAHRAGSSSGDMEQI